MAKDQKHKDAPAPVGTGTGANVPAVQDAKDVLDPAMVMDYSDDIGAGFEEADKNCFEIPRLMILQKMSHAVDAGDAAYVEGAAPGMFLDNVASELYSEVTFIPCAFKRSFLQWSLGDKKAFEGEHMPDDAITRNTTRNEKGQDVLPNGKSYLSDTRTHLGLVVKADGSFTPVALALSSTQMKKSKRWMSIMQNIKVKTPAGMVTPPMFSHMYKLTTVQEKNDKGSWSGLKVELIGATPPELYAAAREFYRSVRSGAVKVRHEDEEPAPGSDAHGDAQDRF